MNMNKLTLAAGLLASASATQISAKANLQAEGVFNDIGNWFENDFVDFWTEDVAGVFEDVGEWFETDFVDFWEKDFVNFWEDALDDTQEWMEQVGNDISDFFENDQVWFWEEEFWTGIPAFASDVGEWFELVAIDVYEGLEDAAEWIVDGDNWESGFSTLSSSIGLLFEGKFQESWEMFNIQEAALSKYDGTHVVMKMVVENVQQMHKRNVHECSRMDVPVLGRTQSGYTITSDFNYLLHQNEIPDAAIYAPLGKLSGPNAVHIAPRDCERVDCMHPCYGHDRMGACNKCTMHMMQHQGERHAICDLCVV